MSEKTRIVEERVVYVVAFLRSWKGGRYQPHDRAGFDQETAELLCRKGVAEPVKRTRQVKVEGTDEKGESFYRWEERPFEQPSFAVKPDTVEFPDQESESPKVESPEPKPKRRRGRPSKKARTPGGSQSGDSEE